MGSEKKPCEEKFVEKMKEFSTAMEAYKASNLAAEEKEEEEKEEKTSAPKRTKAEKLEAPPAKRAKKDEKVAAPKAKAGKAKGPEDAKTPYEKKAATAKAAYDSAVEKFKASGGEIVRKSKSDKADKGGKAKKDNNAPKKPSGGGYGQYLSQHQADIVKSLPAGSNPISDVAKAAGARWKALSESEKKPYEEKFVEKMKEFRTAMEAYKASNLA